MVVGDGAVGLLGVLSAKQMGAERIMAMSRHESRQRLAREFGATDIVTERGKEVTFESVEGKINDRIDDAYRAKYHDSPYLSPMIGLRARSATVKVIPRDINA